MESLKCNVDTVILSELEWSSFAGLIRDDLGRFVKAVSGFVEGVYPPHVAEAVGLCEVLSWIKQGNSSNMIVETDCL